MWVNFNDKNIDLKNLLKLWLTFSNLCIKVYCDYPPQLIVSYRYRCRRDLLRRIVGDRLLPVFRRRFVTFSVGVTWIGVIDRRIFAVLSVILGLVPGTGDAVTGQGWRGHVYPRTDRLEAASGRAIFDLA